MWLIFMNPFSSVLLLEIVTKLINPIDVNKKSPSNTCCFGCYINPVPQGFRALELSEYIFFNIE